ncbi:3-hydroxyacyl-ACP dehydratase FabZ [Gemmatimonas sp.]|jgi:beta-hydroxyacyl-ACP dehydratase FabZ|uniref:3-hydroxyacyl-ACP dehydratase FabZ n=1 Tax=Gemmatimonas sp. TaxID=1962908 RepID=UPI0037C01B32
MSDRPLALESVLDLLPHRYPFLLIDKVVELNPGKNIVCLKNVSINEWFFRGHYPGHPIMPGMLIVEAMAQAGGILILSTISSGSEISNVAYFSGMNGVRFRKPVLPGHQMRMEVEILQTRGAVYKFRGRNIVEGSIATEAEMVVTVRPGAVSV